MNTTSQDPQFFSKPKTCFQKRINEIMYDCPAKPLIKDLVHLHMHKNAEKSQDMLLLIEVYNLLGLEKFVDLLNLVGGKSIKFPSASSFKETIQVALCFYYRNYQDKSWEEIKDLLEEDELPTVKLGIKVTQLQRFIDYMEELVAARYQQKGADNGSASTDA